MKLNETFKTIIRNDLKVGLIPMLLGEPGIGKSSWIKDLAGDLDTKCFTLTCNQLADKADLTGARMVPDGRGGYCQNIYPHVILNEAINYAKENEEEEPILFLDEINRTTTDVTSALLSLPTERKIGNIDLPDNLRIIIAGNDKGNVTVLDDASISRFIPYHIYPDTETYLKVNKDVNKFIEKLLTNQEHLILCKDIESDEDDLFEEGKMRQLTNPRTITYLSRFLNLYKDNELLDLSKTIDNETKETMLLSIIKSHTGNTKFSILLNSLIKDELDKEVPKKDIEKPASLIQLELELDEMNIFAIESRISAFSLEDKYLSLMYAITNEEYQYDKKNYILISLLRTIEVPIAEYISEIAKLTLTGDIEVEIPFEEIKLVQLKSVLEL